MFCGRRPVVKIVSRFVAFFILYSVPDSPTLSPLPAPSRRGHNSLDGTVYAYFILFDTQGRPVSLSRRFVFAGTYHRESPGEKDRKIVADDEETQHIHAGALDPIGFGWAAYELMLNY